MNRYWILVADASRARLFSAKANFEEMIERADYTHPLSRVADRELTSDRPGRAQKSMGHGVRTALEPTSSAHELEAERFSRELADVLREQVAVHPNGNFLVVAPPTFLGLLRRHLDDHTASRIGGTLARDYTRLDVRSLGEALRAHNSAVVIPPVEIGGAPR